ncbi:MAG: aspartate carbamoyltransferase catalytic subunit [Pseudomonadota bacterium]|nr:aspartate carbamoyltransferase catalytic subunit [Pseudomonadota bacterium]
MPSGLKDQSLLSLATPSKSQILKLFECAKEFKTQKKAGNLKLDNSHKTVALVFFEPSTRTRGSFQFASFNLGLNVYSQFFDASTSLVKGESEEDTIQNVVAMGPDILVVRYNESTTLDKALEKISEKLKVPVISGGGGSKGHPTQALGDLFTLWLEEKNLEKQKVLLVGDVGHSRVAASHIELLSKFGIELGFSGPEEWMTPELKKKGRVFSLEEGLKWCSLCMPLRIQWERHADRATTRWRSQEVYHSHFGINGKNIGLLNGLLMSPGPINFGWELTYEIRDDKRCRVLEQVENGVFMRTAILAEILGIKI